MKCAGIASPCSSLRWPVSIAWLMSTLTSTTSPCKVARIFIGFAIAMPSTLLVLPVPYPSGRCRYPGGPCGERMLPCVTLRAYPPGLSCRRLDRLSVTAAALDDNNVFFGVIKRPIRLHEDEDMGGVRHLDPGLHLR